VLLCDAQFAHGEFSSSTLADRAFRRVKSTAVEREGPRSHGRSDSSIASANSSWRWRHGIPGISETLIAKALYPYPAGLVVATKGGLTRPGANRWVTDCRPEHLRRACADSLRRLRLERIAGDANGDGDLERRIGGMGGSIPYLGSR
jgi:hypothetical protein